MQVIPIKVRMPSCTPFQAHSGEWFDLATSENYTLEEGDFQYLDLGVCIQIPEGYEAIVAPRSSTFKRYGLLQANGIGVIDTAYCGDDDWWKFPAYATRFCELKAGTRIAQFRLQKIQEPVMMVVVDKLNNDNRGGLGSTGI